MGRAAAAGALSAVLVLAVAGCAPAGASADEVTEWVTVRQDSLPEDALGILGGPIGRDDPEPAPTDGLTLTFPEPMTLSDVRLECLGDGVVTFSVTIATASGTSTTQTYPDHPCGTIGRADLSDGAATSVRVNAFAADRDGAWNALVIGTPVEGSD